MDAVARSYPPSIGDTQGDASRSDSLSRTPAHYHTALLGKSYHSNVYWTLALFEKCELSRQQYCGHVRYTYISPYCENVLSSVNKYFAVYIVLVGDPFQGGKIHIGYITGTSDKNHHGTTTNALVSHTCVLTLGLRSK